MRTPVIVALAALSLAGASCRQDTLATSTPDPARSVPAAAAPAAGPVTAADVIGSYRQELGWLPGQLRAVEPERDHGTADARFASLQRTMHLAADGTATVVLDASGEVRASGKWTIVDGTIEVAMADGVMRATRTRDGLEVRVRTSVEGRVSTTAWTRQAAGAAK